MELDILSIAGQNLKLKKHYYNMKIFHQQKMFNKEECDKIINLTNTIEKENGKNKYGSGKIDVSFGEYKIEDNEDNNWFMDRIKIFVEETLKVKLNKLNNDNHILSYGINDGFDKHIDYNPDNGPDVRIYTLGVLLNDEFEGGEFIFYDETEIQLKKEIGNCYIFDTKTQHEVKKITNGKRYALIIHIKNSEIKKTLL